jgi:alpha-galactosidase
MGLTSTSETGSIAAETGFTVASGLLASMKGVSFMSIDGLRWGHDRLCISLEWSPSTPVRLSASPTAATGDDPRLSASQPLVEVFAVGHGHCVANIRGTDSAIGARLRYVGHEEWTEVGWQVLAITQADATTGVRVRSILRCVPGVSAFRGETELTNAGDQPLVLQAVSSFASGGFLGPREDVKELDVYRARSSWCMEGRWSAQPVIGPAGLGEFNASTHGQDSRDRFVTTSTSAWSSGDYVPVSALVNRRTGNAWAWQIDHNGPWHWELDYRGFVAPEVALLVFGPTDPHHQWLCELAPGESFVTVPVSVATSTGGFDGVIAELTRHRRALRRPHPQDATLPIIFNDYMNTLEGDPTTAKEMPLIEAAAEVGAEYYVIDAGWYDDGGDWWPSVGAWRPSTVRFPKGLKEVTQHIRSRGMVPGLWLEPEVVGVQSPVANSLPRDAFLQRRGVRVVDTNRYLLDFRHPAVVKHLDEVVDRLVSQFGVGYFKLDYNVTPGPGTDRAAHSPGAGMLDHNRAFLAWLNGVRDRHPDVILESCASGAMRADYGVLSVAQLQSTSDQQGFLEYAAIAASAAASILPEQCGNWAYPHGGMSDDEIAYCMVNGLAGRLYLSGRIDTMTAGQLKLYREAVDVHRALRAGLASSTPFWPCGLPKWDDEWLASGLRSEGSVLVFIWFRGQGTAELLISAAQLIDDLGGGNRTGAEILYPAADSGWGATWDETRGLLQVNRRRSGPGAVVIRVIT